MKQSLKWLLIAALICICGMAANGQAQNKILRRQNNIPQQVATQHGPIRLEQSETRSGPMVPVYTLHLLQLSGTNPVEYVWFLQKIVPPQLGGTIEPKENAYRSLKSPALRVFVSHLPEGTRITHSPPMLPGPDPTMKVPIGPSTDLQDFIEFCQSKKIDFVYGIPF